MPVAAWTAPYLFLSLTNFYSTSPLQLHGQRHLPELPRQNWFSFFALSRPLVSVTPVIVVTLAGLCGPPADCELPQGRGYVFSPSCAGFGPAQTPQPRLPSDTQHHKQPGAPASHEHCSTGAHFSRAGSPSFPRKPPKQQFFSASFRCSQLSCTC